MKRFFYILLILINSLMIGCSQKDHTRIKDDISAKDNPQKNEKENEADRLYLKIMRALENDESSVIEESYLNGSLNSISFPEGETLLHKAILSNAYSITEFLVEKDLHIQTADHDGNTPMSLALEMNDTYLVVLLAEKEAYQGSKNPLVQYHKLKNLVEDGDLKSLRELWQTGKPYSANTLHDYSEFLFIAIEQGYQHMLSFLCREGVGINSQFNGKTPLIAAINEEDLGMVSYLLKKGADVRIPDELGDQPIHIAVENGYLDIIKLLLKRPGVKNAQNKKHNTPLYLAVKNQQPEVVKVLANVKADISIKCENGLTVQDQLMKMSSGEVFDIINKKYRLSDTIIMEIIANNNEIPERYKTHFVSKKVTKEVVNQLFAISNDPYILSMLLSLGADINTISKETGCAAIHTAAVSGNTESLKFLIDKGANINLNTRKLQLSKFNKLRYSPIYYAASLYAAKENSGAYYSYEAEKERYNAEEIRMLEIAKLPKNNKVMVVHEYKELMQAKNEYNSLECVKLLIASGNGRMDITDLAIALSAAEDMDNKKVITLINQALYTSFAAMRK